MQCPKKLAAFAMFPVAVGAVPLNSQNSTPNDASPGVLFAPAPGNSINNCGDSSFDNETSRASPTVSDCLQIAANIAGGGYWEIDGSIRQHQLVQYGSCAFGVQHAYNADVLNYNVGNSDIIDLIHSSVDKYQWNGLIGSKGIMP
jgi:hypothetical protein